MAEVPLDQSGRLLDCMHPPEPVPGRVGPHAPLDGERPASIAHAAGDVGHGAQLEPGALVAVHLIELYVHGRLLPRTRPAAASDSRKLGTPPAYRSPSGPPSADVGR